MNGIRRPRVGGLVLLCGVAASGSVGLVWAQEDAELQRLVEQITRGEEREARDAEERLIERIAGPVAEALGSVESRPVEEQRRLRAVLARLSAALRVRLFRADLEPPERKLFDDFAARHCELVEQLFDDDYRKRLAAVRRIPLDPETGAGVLIVRKVNDSDGTVAATALEAAAKLNDQVVVRGLTRYVRDATAAVKAGHYGPGEEETRTVVALFVDRAIRVLGQTGARESVPTILEALEYFGNAYPPDVFDVAQVAWALGRIGDERAVAPLLELIERDQPYRYYHGDPAGSAVQMFGDVVLLSLLRIYEIPPEALGFHVAEPPSTFAGFVSEQERATARRMFRQWYAENAERPRAERQLPTSRPTGEE